jgi:hypothetical protein
MVEGDMEQVAELVRRRVVDKEPAQRVAADVVDFVGNFKTLKYCFDENADPYEALWKHL